jgi:hypothetical protein
MEKQTLTAGEIFSGECPAGQSAQVRVGDKLPNAEKAEVKVLKVEGAKFELGPVKAGEIFVNVPCSGGVQETSFIVNPMAKEAAQSRFSPLAAERVEFPLALFLIIIGILLAGILAGFIYYFRKKKVKAAAITVKQKESPREILAKEMLFLENNVKTPEAHHIHQLYKKLRKFIERELELKTRSLTTQEFLGTFRALALQQSANQTLISQLEYVLKTADDVRFAGKNLSPELWKDYLSKIKTVIAAFPKKEEKKKK